MWNLEQKLNIKKLEYNNMSFKALKYEIFGNEYFTDTK